MAAPGDRGARPGVVELLETMGCAWAREHGIGMEAHLASASCAQRLSRCLARWNR